MQLASNDIDVNATPHPGPLPLRVEGVEMPRESGVYLDYQKRWAEDMASVKVIEKSRRTGITWSTAGDATLIAAQAEGGDDVWYIGYNKDMAQEFIGDCGTWAKHYNEVGAAVEEIAIEDEGKDILAYVIRFASGHTITALSSAPRNLRGKQGIVILDEAAFHPDLKELLKAAIALLMWGGRVWIISTHNGDANYFNEIINDIRAGKLPYSLHRVTLDDALAEGLYNRICTVLGREWSHEAEKIWRDDLVKSYGEAANEELFCIPSQGGGVFMSRVLVENCMKPELPVVRKGFDDGFVHRPKNERESEVEAWCEDALLPLLEKLDPDRAHYFGEDFGRSGDLTCLWPGAELQNLTIRVPFVLELRNCPFEQQTQIVFFIIDRLPNFRHGCFDGRGNGQYLSEVAMQRYSEFRITQVMISTEWYRDVMPKYKAAYEDKNIEIPRDADILEDHRAVKMEKGVARIPEERTTGADKGKRHGDSAIAGCMLWMATRVEGPAAVCATSEANKMNYHAIRPTRGHGDAETRRKRGIAGRIRELLGRGRT